MAKKKVFLGGTCNNSLWREVLIPQLKMDFFNPVVPEWTDEAYKRELTERENCDFCLYVITPKMSGVYSIAEVIDDSNKRPEKTIFCFLERDTWTPQSLTGLETFGILAGAAIFNKSQIKSLTAVGKMVQNNGGIWLNSLEEVANFLNEKEITSVI